MADGTPDEIEIVNIIDGRWPLVTVAAFLIGVALVVAAAVVMARLEDQHHADE